MDVGSKVVFKSEWPFHQHFGLVVGDVEIKDRSLNHWERCWVVEWEGDQYFPENKGVVSLVPKFNARLQER